MIFKLLSEISPRLDHPKYMYKFFQFSAAKCPRAFYTDDIPQFFEWALSCILFKMNDSDLDPEISEELFNVIVYIIKVYRYIEDKTFLTVLRKLLEVFEG